MKNLTQKRLREVLSYDPVTGIFTRLLKGSRRSQAGNRRPDSRIIITIDGTKYRAHHLAWLWCYGSFPLMEIDHINRQPSDNRIANLREISRIGNVWNAPDTPTKRNRSGFRGVIANTNKYHRDKPWASKIMVRGRQIHLGTFATPEAAHEAYLAAKRERHQGEKP